MSGCGEEEAYCLYNRPRDVYSIGPLSPKPRNVSEDEDNFYADFLAKYSPCSVGMEFLYKKNPGARLKVNINFNVFYRVFPTYEQQINLDSQDLATVFKRKNVENFEIEVSLDDFTDRDCVILNKDNNEKIKDLFDKLSEEIRNDPETICYGELSNMFNDSRPTSEEFSSMISKISKREKVIPEWEFEVRIEIRTTAEGKNEAGVTLINCSKDEFDKDKFFDHYMFNVWFSVELLQGEILPYTFNMLPESYRFERDMWGVGNNCVTKQIGKNHLKTEPFPLYEQARYGTRDKLPNGEKLQVMKFSDLAKDPLPLLERLKSQMVAYMEHCYQNAKDFLDQYSLNLEEDMEQFKASLKKFEEEIERYGRGIELLRKAKEKGSKYKIVYDAFCYMNETFSRMGEIKGRAYDAWRPFQIVFIVSHLIDIVAQHWIDDFKNENNVEKVTVLWFPTGGGKTEAYLGLVVFNLFFDRLRGKENGMTALFRFPLRILSYQQFQRIFNALYFAGVVKKERGIGGKPFSVGHWVGNNQTPNSMDNEEWKNEIAALKNPAAVSNEEMNQVQQKLKRVHQCPECHSIQVKVFYNKQFDTILHKCENCNYLLPIYIVDTAIYRFLPSVVISTVDKIAVAGMQKEFGNLLGDVRYYSPTKGFSWKKEDWEDITEIDASHRKLLRPTLQIQDELHLLKEDLGAYDAHYETMVQTMLKEISGNYHWKIIASTATIQDFDRHVAHLYGKEQHRYESIRFPEEGPKADESFYSVKDEEAKVGRFFLGIMGHNKTHINTMVDVLYNFHKTIQELRLKSFKEFNLVTGLKTISEDEKNSLLDDYEVSLNYVLTKRNADQLAESIASQIADYLSDNNLFEINNEMLTGGTTAEELANVMEKVEKTYCNQPFNKRINSITATSMISHGVDIDRFNFMTFFGIPRQTAEYIQASSRVGRKLPGISIIVFAPQKERDQSYFKYFYKYHQYLDRLVEKPAINRWAKYSIDKTFPGILLGIILNKYSRKVGQNLYFTEAFVRYYNSLSLEEQKKIREEMLRTIENCYVSKNMYGEYFHEKIKENIRTFFEGLRRTRQKYLKDFIGYSFGHQPMSSLRDTEEEKKFYKSSELQKYSNEIKF